MASGHVSRTRRPHTWLLRPDCDLQKVLANKAPFHTWHSTANATLNHQWPELSEQETRNRGPIFYRMGPYLTQFGHPRSPALAPEIGERQPLGPGFTRC